MERIKHAGRTVMSSFVRPNDTNAYTAGDVVADSTSAPTIMTFGNASSGDGSFTKLQHAIIITSANVAAAKPDLELWLFDTTVAMDNDNAVFTPTDTEAATLVAVIAFPVASFKVGDATAGAGGNAICEARGLEIPLNTLRTVNDLFGILVVRNAYVPVAQETFTVRLKFID